ERVGVNPAAANFYPLIMVLDSKGEYVAHMDRYSDVPGLELREDSGEEFRGFERSILLRELEALRRIALEQDATPTDSDPSAAAGG
ncbi:MAG: hypothetical protein AAF533_11205, partial [Acidobacteriota bacterium]